MTRITYNGVDLTDKARGTKIELPPPVVVSTRDHGVEVTMTVDVPKEQVMLLMRALGASRRIWTTRKHKRPRGRVVVLD